MTELLESSAFVAAVMFGFRHGFDWDHLAALSDLTGSQTSSRRSMWLASLYAAGHALMVLVLGAVAIVFAEQVPAPVDAVMGRIVGVSLLALGGWMVWTAVRTRGAPPLRSRWMLLVAVLRRGMARWPRRERRVVIEHSHPHDHGQPMHDHAHLAAVADHGPVANDAAGDLALVVTHQHAHRHVALAPRDPFTTYGSLSSFGVGVLHGIGAETPTQLLVFAAAANASGRPASIGLLACFVVGLLVANTIVAAACTFGFRGALRNQTVAVTLAAVTVTFSVVVGSLLLLGRSTALPEILG